MSRQSAPGEESSGANAGVTPETGELTPEEEIAGLDMAGGLARFGGDMATYIEMLASYVRHTPALLEQLRALVREDLPNFCIAVHGVKASSRSIGALAVGNLAAALEDASRAGDADFVRTHTPPFLEDAGNLLAALTAWLEARAVQKPVRDDPDPSTLETLRRACEKFDVDHMEQAMRTLTSYSYRPGPGAELVAWLEDQSFQMRFKQIAARLGEKSPA